MDIIAFILNNYWSFLMLGNALLKTANFHCLSFLSILIEIVPILSNVFGHVVIAPIKKNLNLLLPNTKGFGTYQNRQTTGFPKKRFLRRCVIFNPKNVTICFGIDQNKKLPSFWPIGQKMLILHENLEFSMARENFPLKRGIFTSW